MSRKVDVQNVEQRLAEVDRLIMNVSEEGCTKIRRGAPVSEVDVDVNFLRTLYRRRDVILHELKKAGIAESEAYAHLRTGTEGAALI